jgi:hypothetical protein
VHICKKLRIKILGSRVNIYRIKTHICKIENIEYKTGVKASGTWYDVEIDGTYIDAATVRRHYEEVKIFYFLSCTCIYLGILLILSGPLQMKSSVRSCKRFNAILIKCLIQADPRIHGLRRPEQNLEN